VHLTEKVVTEISHAPVVAGSADVTDCNVVDMQNFDAVRFIVGFGTITAGAVTSINAKQADAKTSDTALTSGQDLLGTKVTVADDGDNKVYVLDIVRPQKRYLQLLIKRATQNAVVDFAIHEKYHARTLPVTQTSGSVGVHELHVSPAEGTA
jgi:O-glycosyl hydrolase